MKKIGGMRPFQLTIPFMDPNVLVIHGWHFLQKWMTVFGIEDNSFPENCHRVIYVPQLTFPFMYGFGDGDCEQQFRQTPWI